jgi:hypothetical protein
MSGGILDVGPGGGDFGGIRGGCSILQTCCAGWTGGAIRVGLSWSVSASVGLDQPPNDKDHEGASMAHRGLRQLPARAGLDHSGPVIPTSCNDPPPRSGLGLWTRCQRIGATSWGCSASVRRWRTASVGGPKALIVVTAPSRSCVVAPCPSWGLPQTFQRTNHSRGVPLAAGRRDVTVGHRRTMSSKPRPMIGPRIRPGLFSGLQGSTGPRRSLPRLHPVGVRPPTTARHHCQKSTIDRLKARIDS